MLTGLKMDEFGIDIATAFENQFVGVLNMGDFHNIIRVQGWGEE